MHDVIAQHIGATVAGLTYSESGGNVFVDFMPQTPDRAVGVFTAAGSEPDSKLPYDPVVFQVLVRGAAADGIWALATARAIYSKLHSMRNVTLYGTYVVWCVATQGSPFYLGEDETGRVQYTIDFRGETLNATEERA